MSRPRSRLTLPALCLLLAASACFCSDLSGEAEQPTEAPGPAATEEPTAESLATPTVRPPAPPPVLTPSVPTPAPTPLVEERIAEVEWPAVMRVGDGDVIRLSLIPTPVGSYVAVPEIPGHEVEPTPIPLTVARPGYTAYVAASLSAAGIEVERAGPATQLLVPGGSNTWRWTICPHEAGTHRVVVNLAVEWRPEEGSGLPGPFTESVWSRTLTVEARTKLRLSGKQIDWVGAGGSALGFVAGLPFTKKALETLWKRIARSRGKKRGGR